MEEKQTKICPFCGKEILIKAQKCKFCGSWLNQQETKPESVQKLNTENIEATKTCPYCCQHIPKEAQKCQFCGEWIKQKPEKENVVYKCFTILTGILIVIIGGILEYASGGNGAGVVFALIVGILLGIYFLPTTIADNKRHKNTTSIFVVNLFFGCTLIGWVIALVWALTEEH